MKLVHLEEWPGADTPSGREICINPLWVTYLRPGNSKPVNTILHLNTGEQMSILGEMSEVHEKIEEALKEPQHEPPPV